MSSRPTPEGPADASAPERIDAKIQATAGWRGETLARLRALIHEAEPEVVEVWGLDGNVRRAIDFREGEPIDEAAFKALLRAAVALNLQKPAK